MEFGPHYFMMNAQFEDKDGRIVTESYLDPVGVLTGPAGIIANPDGSPIGEDQTWTLEAALDLYNDAHEHWAEEITGMVRVPLKQHQFDALGILAWNIGLEALRNSTVLRKVNEGRFEEAAAAFAMWKYATLVGGKMGPDGRLAEGPDNKPIPKGKVWKKAFRGIYRRSLSAALLFMGLDWHSAAASNRIELIKQPLKKSHGWTDEVLRKTEWHAVLSDARDDPLPVIEVAEQEPIEPEPVPAPVEVPPLIQAPKKVEPGPMPPELPPSPTGYGKIDPAASPKEWWQSRREWGRIIQLVTLSIGAERVTNTQAIAAAEIGGLFMVIVIGWCIMKWGERNATRYTK